MECDGLTPPCPMPRTRTASKPKIILGRGRKSAARKKNSNGNELNKDCPRGIAPLAGEDACGRRGRRPSEMQSDQRERDDTYRAATRIGSGASPTASRRTPKLLAFSPVQQAHDAENQQRPRRRFRNGVGVNRCINNVAVNGQVPVIRAFRREESIPEIDGSVFAR